MTVATYEVAPAALDSDIAVVAGPLLLRTVGLGPSLRAHREVWPAPGSPSGLVRDLTAIGLTGRGGAGFPFARKLTVALRSGTRRELVVNAAEGEPASAKDSALMTTAPHLVLDGAELVAALLGAERVHVVVPGERPAVAEAVARAVSERSGRRSERFVVHPTSGGFVGGQARAVVEMLAGRPDLPVTSARPEAVSGLRGLPTVVSNAETFAHVGAVHALGVAAYGAVGTPEEPGTRLMSIGADGPDGVVLEVAHGTPLAAVLAACRYPAEAPVLAGGYHGTWLSPAATASVLVSASSFAEFGARLGAGVVLPMEPGDCPVRFTSEVVRYLAGQGAGRCGPCANGLPALAAALTELAAGQDRLGRVRQLCGLVTRRGACAHPDGTAGMVASLLEAFPAEIGAHRSGVCTAAVRSGGSRRRW